MKLPISVERERATKTREAEFRIDGRLIDCTEKAVNMRMSRDATVVPRLIVDNMVAYLTARAGDLAANVDNPQAEAELERIVDLIQAYEGWRSRPFLSDNRAR